MKLCHEITFNHQMYPPNLAAFTQGKYCDELWYSDTTTFMDVEYFGKITYEIDDCTIVGSFDTQQKLLFDSPSCDKFNLTLEGNATDFITINLS